MSVPVVSNGSSRSIVPTAWSNRTVYLGELDDWNYWNDWNCWNREAI